MPVGRKALLDHGCVPALVHALHLSLSTFVTAALIPPPLPLLQARVLSSPDATVEALLQVGAGHTGVLYIRHIRYHSI